MKPDTIYLTPVRRHLEQADSTLEQLWLDHAAVWQRLGWKPSRVKLWLRCQPDIHIDRSDPANPIYRLSPAAGSGEDNLAGQIVALLESAGRPMPLTLLMNRLPPGMLVTEPMLRAAIHADPRLGMAGPIVKLR